MSGRRHFVWGPRVSRGGHIHILQQDSAPTIWMEEASSELTSTNHIVLGTYGQFIQFVKQSSVWKPYGPLFLKLFLLVAPFRHC